MPFETLGPIVISAISVGVAVASVLISKRVAVNQGFFVEKAKVYADFLRAFAELSYDCGNADKRSALTHALYCACIYAPLRLQKEMNYLANRAMRARTREDFVNAEFFLQDLLDDFGDDLHHRRLKRNTILFQESQKI